MTTRLTILSYHNVEGTWAFPSAPGSGFLGFQQQMAWLRRHMTVVPLGSSLTALDRGEALPRRAVAVTFDDGYRDNLELAAAELSEHGMPATFFLVPGLIEREVQPWWEVSAWALTATNAEHLDWDGRRYELDGDDQRREARRAVARQMKGVDRSTREALVDDLVDRLRPGPRPDFGALYVDRDGARALAGGGFDIGSHSWSHPILARETPEAQQDELSRSRAYLEQLLARPVTVLAYPNGTVHDYDAHTIEAARAAGYQHAVTTRNGTNTTVTPVHELRRFVMYPERGDRPGAWFSAVSTRARRVARDRLAVRGAA